MAKLSSGSGMKGQEPLAGVCKLSTTASSPRVTAAGESSHLATYYYDRPNLPPSFFSCNSKHTKKAQDCSDYAPSELE